MRLRLLSLLLVVTACTDVPAPTDHTQAGKADGDGDGETAILLDCNTSLGPDQQVTVLDTGDGLVLRELTTSGAQVDRPLSSSEWKSEMLLLRDEGFDSLSTMTKDGDAWAVHATGGGVNELGYADCWIDTSK
jgi:hypothetical protein